MPAVGDRRAVQYPSPFSNIATTYFPSTVRELYRLMEYYYISFPEAFRIVFDMASFPVTEIAIDDSERGMASTFRELYDGPLDAKNFCRKIGLDHFCFGLSYSTVMMPREKYLTCPNCNEHRPLRAWDWLLRQKKFVAVCHRCRSRGAKFISEQPIRDPRRIKFVRWAPRDIRQEINPATGDVRHRYIPPARTRVRVLAGDDFAIETTPLAMIHAILNDRVIEVMEENLFTTSMPSPSLKMVEDGSGLPLLVSVLKLIHFVNVLRRGEEAVAHDHIAPMRWLSPAPNAGQSAADLISLSKFQDTIMETVNKHRSDPNYVAGLPFPVNIQNFGGDANSLFVEQVVQQSLQSIASGLGMPLQFLTGDMTWSAGNVSLRVLGNRILDQGRELSQFLRFSADRIAAFLQLRRVDQIGLVDFKLTDDPQRLQMLVTLYQLGLITGEILVREATGKELDELMDDLEEEQKKMDEIMEKRSIRQAEISMRAQIAAQQVQMESMGGAGMMQDPYVSSTEQGDYVGGEQMLEAAGGDVGTAEAWRIARKLQNMSPQQQQLVLGRYAMSGHAQLAEQVRQFLAGDNTGVDTRAMPEQKPPRRESVNTVSPNAA